MGLREELERILAEPRRDDVVTCPCCGLDHEDLHEIGLDDGEKYELECYHCMHSFTVVCTVTVSYEVCKEDE